MKGRKGTRENRRARFEVAIEETLEAGLALTSDEIKSIRADRVQLTGGYVKLLGAADLPEPVVVGLHLSAAVQPERTRKLLLHAREIRHLQEELNTKGKTAVPLRIYFKRGWAKVEIGIGRGRKQHDKRRLLRERDIARDQAATLKNR